MISVYKIKPYFQKMLRPFLLLLAKFNVSPNTITLTAFVGSIAVGALIAFSGRHNTAWLWVVPIWLFLRMALNALDGMMAREMNRESRWGAVLNELGDVLSDLVIFLPLALVVDEALWAIILFSIGAALTEFCGLLGHVVGSVRHYEGPMGKSDRALSVGLIVTMTALFPAIFEFWQWFFMGLFSLTLWTCVNRLKAINEEKLA